MRVMSRVSEWEGWLKSAGTGERVIYFQGELGKARAEQQGGEPMAIASMALSMETVGLVHLFQVRSSGHEFDYIAERSSRGHR